MNMYFNKRFLQAFLRKWRKLSIEALARDYRRWELLSRSSINDEEFSIPKDVPKGHLVVYVGEERKRFVIHVSFLDHPMFRALLDRAQEVYEFNPDSKLRIPCDESMFLGVLRCVGSHHRQEKRIWLCL
ncbi:uncharacterized protein A4U43_C01F8250 [Asparagus officinalis]|uniref:Uncharacterized protein n=1 Tax=Asparagus officinalis TaxID=4686 RepID=A0A5P1FND4_ASPOF|nr:auxin-responsive protein SAUR50-like [Asparagus officinalis]ONK79622.1 uncharacterized protein A4U43_C01F8250 [Asparagus officinalis]